MGGEGFSENGGRPESIVAEAVDSKLRREEGGSGLLGAKEWRQRGQRRSRGGMMLA